MAKSYCILPRRIGHLFLSAVGLGVAAWLSGVPAEAEEIQKGTVVLVKADQVELKIKDNVVGVARQGARLRPHFSAKIRTNALSGMELGEIYATPFWLQVDGDVK